MTIRKTAIRKPPRSMLVITYGGHGDILLTTPLIASLKKAFPEATIDVYLQNGRGGMLAGNPHVRAVFESVHRRGVTSYTEFFFRHTARYDLAVSTRMSDRQVVFCRAAGRRAVSLVPSRGHNQFWKEAILDGWVRQDCQRHEVFEILRLAEVLGIEKILACRPPSDPASERRLDGLLPFDWRSAPYATMHLTPRNRYKAWTVHGWRAVARHLRSQGLNVVLVGSPSEYEAPRYAANLVADVSDGVVDLTGRITLADAAALLGRCRAYVGPDTAVTHLAAVVEAPTVALYGWVNSRYMPYHEALSECPYRVVSPHRLSSGHVQVVIGECKCPPGESLCEHQPREYSDCMRSIPLDLVTATLDAVLKTGYTALKTG